MPKSGMVVLPRMTAPLSRSRAAAGASAPASWASMAAVPAGIGTPRVAIFSFTVTGTPSSGPCGVPACHRASEARAAASALSASIAQVAQSRPSQASIRASDAAVTSTGERSPARKARTMAEAVRSGRSVMPKS
jgi:hypothetical protein